VTKRPVTKWSAVPCGDSNENLHSCSAHAQKSLSPSDKWKIQRRRCTVATYSNDSSDMLFELKRLQFPVLLAFAMTNLKNPWFSHGLLYVACSRVGKPSNLFVYTVYTRRENEKYCIFKSSSINTIKTK
jgi:hypothetical protein